MTVRRRLPEVLRRPPQGWSSLFFLLAMLVVLGISFADARPLQPVLGGASLTSSLPILLPLAGLIGFVLARSRLGVVRAHLLGATVAAVTLLWLAGDALLTSDPAVQAVGAVSPQVGAVWVWLEADVRASVSGETSTPVITYLLLAGILWTTAQFSAFSIFRYDRGGPAAVAIGTVLFLNVGLGSTVPPEELLPVLPVLAIFATLAMGLLVRMQLLQQRLHWARRHIADTGEVRGLFLRSGAIFVALTIISTSSLTAVATVEPVSVRISELEEPIQDFGDQLARWLGLVGVPPPDAAPQVRGNESNIANDWTPGTGTAFTASLQGPLRGNYWWGWADDLYDPAASTWRRTRSTTETVEAGQPMPIEPETAGRQESLVTLELGDAEPPIARAQLFRLSEVAVVEEEDVTALTIDRGQGLTDIRWADPLDEGDVVTMTSFVHDYLATGAGITADDLREAPEDYPGWFTRKYLQGRGDAEINGQGVQALVDRISRRHDNAYDRALALQDHFINGDYEYVTSLDCDAYSSIPECVIAEQKGFCTHYATTMTMALREMGIPSRFVTGYLPGEPDLAGESWTVPQAALHNWTEVYFPGYGWIRFDPTPRAEFGQNPTALPEREEEFQQLPDEEFIEDPPLEELPATPEPSPGAVAGPIDEGGGGPGAAFIVIGTSAIAVLVLSVIGLLLLYRLRRLPDGDGGLAYRGIVSLATRLGYGPHPSQTEYEYAGALSEAIPSVRQDLYLVAEARVETAYGQRRLDRERRGLLRRAYSRIRTALLRLSIKRR